jgi:hypothetical protein
MTETLSLAPAAWSEARLKYGKTTEGNHAVVMSRRYNQLDAREFSLSWQNLDSTEIATLDAIHAATFGGSLEFIWTPPDEVDSIRVRFLSGQRGYTRSRNSATSWSANAVLVETVEAR